MEFCAESKRRWKRIAWWAGLLGCACAVLWSSVVLWSAWRNRPGTPGDPVDFYVRVHRDGMELNRRYFEINAGRYDRAWFLVDLSQTGLTPEEKGEVLDRLGESWPEFAVADFPMPEESYHLYILVEKEGKAVLGGSSDTTDRVLFYALQYEIQGDVPPPEELGVRPIHVRVQMYQGGWDGCSFTYLHHPRKGWIEVERSIAWTVSGGG